MKIPSGTAASAQDRSALRSSSGALSSRLSSRLGIRSTVAHRALGFAETGLFGISFATRYATSGASRLAAGEQCPAARSDSPPGWDNPIVSPTPSPGKSTSWLPDTMPLGTGGQRDARTEAANEAASLDNVADSSPTPMDSGAIETRAEPPTDIPVIESFAGAMAPDRIRARKGAELAITLTEDQDRTILGVTLGSGRQADAAHLREAAHSIAAEFGVRLASIIYNGHKV